VIISENSWFYVKNCIFEHMTDKNFRVTGPFRRPTAPTAPHTNVEVLEPPLGTDVNEQLIQYFVLVSIRMKKKTSLPDTNDGLFSSSSKDTAARRRGTNGPNSGSVCLYRAVHMIIEVHLNGCHTVRMDGQTAPLMVDIVLHQSSSTTNMIPCHIAHRRLHLVYAFTRDNGWINRIFWPTCTHAFKWWIICRVHD